MPKEDAFFVEELPDGSFKVTTDGVSAANHMSAEEFMKFMSRYMGPAVERKKNKRGHVHVHEHLHEHAHI